MNKTTLFVLGIIIILAVGGFVYYQNRQEVPAAPTTEVSGENNSAENSTQTATSSANTSSGSSQTSGITSAEVATHNSRSSCWSIINGSVYDLTSWIPNHPGGEQAILQLCGTDGSAKFNGVHGGSQTQLTVLAGFKIGVAAQ